MNASAHINKLLADAVWNSYMGKRYGLRNCGSNKHSMETLSELRKLHASQTERILLGVLETVGCGLNRLEEKINTL
jgi:hypothetical protein